MDVVGNKNNIINNFVKKYNMSGSTYIKEKNWNYNEPFSSEFFIDDSILPERFRTISEPTEIPILSEDLNSITEPILFSFEKEEKVKQE